MKAMRIEGNWGLENIRPVELADPEPGPDDVVIRIEAISINPRDLVMMQGGYGRMGGSLPFVPLCDGAGRIVATGTNVTRVKQGDLVCPAFSRTWLHGTAGRDTLIGAHGGPLDGTACELMQLPANAVVRAPAHMSAQEAATLPCAAVTAWNALIEEGHLKAGQTVLLQGTGGVSLFALQIAKMQGAEVILTSSSDEKLELAGRLGADHLINYKATPDWHKTARDITDGEGVDHIVEVGGAGTLDKSAAAIKASGTIAVIGVLGGAASELQLGRIVTRHVRLQGVTVGSCEMFRAMAAAMALHGTKPVIDEKRFELAELAEALARLPKVEHIGKIVGTVPI
ncbi:MAG: NAD(P)-dependent alcohol dehydrogenase [Rhizobiales bacterium]|nr:NAD(P)-dependent alcohol dehydrogenase [Hyphomicrobiales bacterium]